METAERASGEKALGVDPVSGKPVIVRIGRFGPMAQIGAQDDEEKPRFASLLSTQSMETISLEEVLELFKLPRDLGEYKDHAVTVAIGRFGPYVRYNNLFCSLQKDAGDDPMTLSMDRAIVLIEEKLEAEKNKYIKTFDEDDSIQVLNGRYGPYIKAGKKNVKIPKDMVPESLTLEQCLELAAKAPEKKSRRKK